MTSRKAPRAPTKKRPTKHTPPPSRPNVRPPAPGPGRPRKPRPPRGEHQVALAEAIERAEAERDAAAVEYSTGLTIAAELRLLRGELAVASAWSSYCRAQGTHSPAIRYSEQVVKLAGRLVALREIEAADKLDLLMKRAGREDALGRPR